MDIITRAEWGARPPTSRVTTSPSNREYYVVHHSGASVTQTVRAIQDWCMDGRGFADIDYNFLVRGNTGQIYEGRGWDVVGAHTVGYNTSGVGVCIIGTDQCSDAAKLAVRWLYAQYNARCGKTLKIRGHRDLATTGTDCPGDRNYAWVHAGMPAPTTPEEDDVTPEDINAIKSAILGDGGIQNLLIRVEALYSGRDPSTAGPNVTHQKLTALGTADAATKTKLDEIDAEATQRAQAESGRDAALASQVSQVDEEVWAKVPDPGVSVAEKAALLRAVLGDDAAAVGALLAQV